MIHYSSTKIQIIFSVFLLFGLTLAITQGSLNLLEFNIGVGLMLITTAIWMLAHTITKPLFDKNEATPTQIVFIRNTIAGSVLICGYFIFFPISNIILLLNPLHIFFFALMAFFYSFDVLFWYKSLEHIEVSKASVIVSPMPILVAFLAYLILGEVVTIYHLIATIIVVDSILIIVRKRE